MGDFSEQNLRENCPHCDPNSFALKYPLKESNNFWAVCDVHPLVEGHVLIIPKKHLSCIGEYPDEDYREFIDLYSTFSKFVKDQYGSVSTFEHGKTGQTVFHSHIHILPFSGEPEQIISEGKETFYLLNDIAELRKAFRKDNRYLFFSIGNRMWIVNLDLSVPRFFRDRFAKALGVPERGNWKEMDASRGLMEKALREMKNLQKTWKLYSK